MRLHVGPIPTDEHFRPEIEGWKPVNQPGPWAIQFATVPIAVVVSTFLMACFNAAIPGAIYKPKLYILEYAVWMPFVAIVLLVPLHELIHALCYPNFGKTDEILIGIWPRKILVYAYYAGTMGRHRYIMTLLTPFLVLSFLPILLILPFRQLPMNASVLAFLTVVSVMNGIASCGDILGAGLVFWRLPRKALIRFQGWKSYWKRRGETLNLQASESSMPVSSSSSPLYNGITVKPNRW